MTERELDEFDEKAKQFLEEGNSERLEDILKEFAMCVSYENGDELENPSRFMKQTGIETKSIDDFTEYQVAKTVIKDEIRKGPRYR
ncbi:MAG: hypothetical protein ABEK01_02635 [Candidatus Nanohaloarchaea archaeon]